MVTLINVKSTIAISYFYIFTNFYFKIQLLENRVKGSDNDGGSIYVIV